jgi:predicted transposase YdaD
VQQDEPSQAGRGPRRRGQRPYDITTKLLLEGDPAGWLRWLGLPVDGPVVTVASEVSTVLAEADRVVRVNGPTPWLAHVELQASYDRLLPLRMLRYHALLLHRHELPVESTVVLLRQEADGPGLDGHLEQTSPSGRLTLAFEYHVVRVWQEPVETLLRGSLAIVPLAPLADLGSASLDDVVAGIAERVAHDAPPEAVPSLWTNVGVLMGLRYHSDEIRSVLGRVRGMRESVFYQEILAEGREEGVAIGRQEGRQEGEQVGRASEARRLLLLFGEARLGPADAGVRRALDAVTDPDALDRLAERLLTAASWQDLLGA